MRRLTLTTLALTGCLSALACSTAQKDGPPVAREHVSQGPSTGNVNVTVTFPNGGVEATTNSIHIFVIDQTYVPKDGGKATCGDLVGTGIDPYSTVLGRPADSVTKRTDPNQSPFDAPISVTKVQTGKAFVYVEAVDYGGQVSWAGCVEVTVGASTSAAVTLVRAGVYDCTDPSTKDGAPCDDGKQCTVGEKCVAGVCKDGVDRATLPKGAPESCAILGDACNAFACDETRGCYQNPLANGTLCDDGNGCTNNDACNAGKCVGTTDCSAADPCAETCTGGPGYCYANTYKATGTPCDDGNGCTIGDSCYRYSSGTYGYCQSGSYCPGDNSGYCSGTCSGNTCVYPTGSYCYTGSQCVTNQTCSSTGTCGGGTPVSCAANAGSCYDTTCDPTYGCSKPLAMGTACSTGSCTTYSLAGTPHCDSVGDCYYWTSGTVGSYGCY